MGHKRRQAVKELSTEFLAVRYGPETTEAFLQNVLPAALNLESARRVFKLRGYPAGILFFATPTTDGEWSATEIVTLLQELPVTTRTVVYLGNAPLAQLITVVENVDVVMFDCKTQEQFAAAPRRGIFDVAELIPLFKELRRQVRIVPKLWVGRPDGDLGRDYLRLDQVCSAGLENGLRLGLNFAPNRGPASPVELERFCRHVNDRFPRGKVDWGGFIATANYRHYLEEITESNGWTRWGWDAELGDQQRLKNSNLLL